MVGSPFTFTCRTVFPPEVTWFVNDTEYMVYGSGRGKCYPDSPLPTHYTFNCRYEIFTLTINSVNISQHGTVWRCGFRRGRPESNTIVLEVRGGPGSSLHVNTSSSVYVNEMDDVAVSCAADCFLRCDYTWIFNGKTISNTSILSVSGINRTQTGVYTCTAVNPDTGQTANTTVDVYVQHGPGSTIRLNTPSKLFPEEGSDVAVSCAADCFIRCDYTWKYNDKTVSNSAILSISRIDKSQTGIYTCSAVNPDTRQSANTTVLVDVLYQPVIKRMQLKKPDTKEAVVDEVRPITLICVVDSNPTSSMKLFRGRQLVRQMTNVTSLEYTWREAVCQTSGTYSCEAENSVKSPARHTLELAVECIHQSTIW
ncbi:carcinoembryonic antigen-related cell adhesion molecule 5-like [Gigantopelta aegis]|uniref:carcinoembryonic antigen-related cell adhesion molecule 5-like n=1 Tax=Gigantopelta aegis TaxID=1735272 RepID=UPI001B88C404|nr:carcinoembryonic antigen-related cell adhesion molecule 5-like [Gigantopelta aegis]